MLLSLIFSCAIVAADAPENIDTLVICPVEFQAALEPWLQYRRGQGYKIAVRPTANSADGIKATIREFYETGSLKHVVLVGDSGDQRQPPHLLVPTDFIKAKVNVKFGSEPEIATDHTYAGLDNDKLQDLNIGRIPIDSADELSDYIQRVVRYESPSNQGSWQRRVNLVAGVGGFGRFVDKTIERSAKKVVTDLIPSAYDVDVTYGSWRSPYCPNPLQFSQTAISKFNQGCQFWIYIGHGHRQRLDKVRLPDRLIDILDTHSVSELAAKKSAPIAVLMSCYSAATDGKSDGLGELMIKRPQGPIAVISSTRVSMPYAMGILSLEMLDEFYRGDSKTFGELVLHSKRQMVDFDEEKSEYHLLFSALGQAFSPQPELLAAERGEHVHLMHVLGDPLLQLHRPKRLGLQAADSVQAGQTLLVSGHAEVAGRLTVDVSYRRNRFRHRPPRRKDYQPSPEFFESYEEVYKRTLNLLCVEKSIEVSKGPFSVELLIPDDCSGACHVRGMIEGDGVFVLGSKDVDVTKMR